MRKRINRNRIIGNIEIQAIEAKNSQIKISHSQETGGEEETIEVPQVDSYLERLRKYIPTEILGAYILLSAQISENSETGVWNENTLLAIVFLGCLILTPIYKYFQLNDGVIAEKPWKQIIVSTGAFVVWVFYLGDWFKKLLGDNYSQLLALIILVFYTLIIPLALKNIDERKSSSRK